MLIQGRNESLVMTAVQCAINVRRREGSHRQTPAVSHAFGVFCAGICSIQLTQHKDSYGLTIQPATLSQILGIVDAGIQQCFNFVLCLVACPCYGAHEIVVHIIQQGLRGRRQRWQQWQRYMRMATMATIYDKGLPSYIVFVSYTASVHAHSSR